MLCFISSKGKNATQAREKICSLYGKDTLSERMCQKWFAKFRSGDFTLRKTSGDRQRQNKCVSRWRSSLHDPRRGRNSERIKIKRGKSFKCTWIRE